MTPQQRADKRDAVYRRDHGRYGFVPCFVCRQHVKRHESTLEHVVPKSKGGGDFMWNLAISHRACNLAKGDKIVARRVKERA